MCAKTINDLVYLTMNEKTLMNNKEYRWGYSKDDMIIAFGFPTWSRWRGRCSGSETGGSFSIVLYNLCFQIWYLLRVSVLGFNYICIHFNGNWAFIFASVHSYSFRNCNRWSFSMINNKGYSILKFRGDVLLQIL